MAHQQIKRFLRRGEESIRRIRVLFGNMLANLPQVVPDGRLDNEPHPRRTAARRASQSAAVGSRPGAWARWRNSRSVSGSRSKSGTDPSHGNSTARLPSCSITVASPAIALAINSSTRALNVATSTVLIVKSLPDPHNAARRFTELSSKDWFATLFDD